VVVVVVGSDSVVVVFVRDSFSEGAFGVSQPATSVTLSRLSCFFDPLFSRYILGFLPCDFVRFIPPRFSSSEVPSSTEDSKLEELFPLDIDLAGSLIFSIFFFRLAEGSIFLSEVILFVWSVLLLIASDFLSELLLFFVSDLFSGERITPLETFF